MKIDIIELYTNSPYELKIVLIVGVLFLTYKGAIKIPFLPIGNKTTHDGCNLQHDIDRIIKESVEKSQSILRIKYIDTLYEQMSALEVIHDDITIKMKGIYSEIATNQKDIDHYRLLVDDIEKELKGLIRKWYKENHFTSRTELEFATYVNEKVEHLIKRVSYHLDDRYKGFEISRDIIKEKNFTDLVPMAQESFKKAFYLAREISREKESLVKKIEGNTIDIK